MDKSVQLKVIFLFLDQNIYCGCSKELSQWDGSFEHPKQMFKLIDKKILIIFCWKKVDYLDSWICYEFQCNIEHPLLLELLKPIQQLYEDVHRKALMRLEYEGLHKAEAITTPGARFYKDPAGFAMDRYAYYVCYKCNKVG